MNTHVLTELGDRFLEQVWWLIKIRKSFKNPGVRTLSIQTEKHGALVIQVVVGRSLGKAHSHWQTEIGRKKATNLNILLKEN